jgi:hypothetical protein
MPTNSARSLDSIVQGIKESSGEVNPAADIRKGPLAVAVWAISNELARTEEFVQYLLNLYQYENPELIEEDDLYNIAANYGKDPNAGRATQTVVHFYMLSRPEPGKVYPIPVGSSCSTEDGRFVYSSLNFGQIDGNYADSYYNSTDQWYEIPILVEARNVGSEYDLPPETITRVLDVLEDYDGCINKSDVTRQGSDPVDPIRLINNLQNTLQGVGTDLGGKIIDVIQDIDPTGFSDIAFVPSSDFERFKRNKILQGRLGYDVYVITEVTQQRFQEGTARGGETRIPLDRGPVLSVEYVNVNGSPVAFSFNPETSPALANSPEGTYEVVLSDPLLPLQSYQISYLYYSFCWEANNALSGREAPFQTETLVRIPENREVYIAGEAIVSSSGDREQVLSDLQTFTERYLANPESPELVGRTFVAVLDPGAYVRNAVSSVTNLSDIKLTGFVRLDDARLPIELITFDGATEVPLLSPNFDVI